MYKSINHQNNEYKIAPNKPHADQNSFKAYEACNYMYLNNQLLYLNPKSFNASKLNQTKPPVAFSQSK
jgi:hypothetical protein